MTFVHGRNVAILHGAYDLTTYFNSVDVPNEVEEVETTTFGSTAKTFLLGFAEGAISLEGYWDGSASAVDARLQAVLGGSGTATTVGWNGTTIGNRCVLASGIEKKYDITAGVGDAVAVAAEMRADGGVDYGIFLHAKTAESTDDNTASVDNSAATTNGYATTLHVTALSGGGTWTIKVQHSTNNSVWADLVTFTAATGLTSERKTGTGTVNRYLRVLWTIAGGSGNAATFAVAFARR